MKLEEKDKKELLVILNKILFPQKNVVSRVTRMDEFSPIGRIFSLGSFFENYRSCAYFWVNTSSERVTN
jgi:flagellar biosynthesis protein FlhB